MFSRHHIKAYEKSAKMLESSLESFTEAKKLWYEAFAYASENSRAEIIKEMEKVDKAEEKRAKTEEEKAVVEEIKKEAVASQRSERTTSEQDKEKAAGSEYSYSSLIKSNL